MTMIDTIHLLPPDLGPRSNPVLFGIAEALQVLLPLAKPTPPVAGEAQAEPVRAPDSRFEAAPVGSI